MATVSNELELAQCMAYAYFAHYPLQTNVLDNDLLSEKNPHAIDFFKMVSNNDIDRMSLLKRKYLSRTFDISRMVKKFSSSLTEKTNQPIYHMVYKKVYRVAYYTKSIFKNIPLREFRFLDQVDPLFILIKNRVLHQVKRGFNLTFNIDILSSIDIMVIRRIQQLNIKREFEAFIKTDFIFNHEYNAKIRQLMDNHHLLQISLKLPTTLNQQIHIKKVEHSVRETSSPPIDPYIQFLDVCLDNPARTTELIKDLITIQFDKFDVDKNLLWKFPVTFNFKKIIKDWDNTPIGNNLVFNLLAQGNGQGWNGRFETTDATTKQWESSTYVGGLGIKTFEYFAKSYSGYMGYEKELLGYRYKAFKELNKEILEDRKNKAAIDAFCVANPKNENLLKNTIKAAQQKILEPGILEKRTFNEYLTKGYFKFLSDITKEHFATDLDRYESRYIQKFLNIITNLMPGNKYPTHAQNWKYLLAFWIHAQVSYFMFRYKQNPAVELFFKKRMFLTIYGLITKKSITAFNITNYSKMRSVIKDIISTSIKRNGSIIKSTWQVPSPHYIIS